MELNNINSIYFLGAGGIGMSALVRYFLAEGKQVAGYDRTPSELTKKLVEEGAELNFEDNTKLIPQWCRDNTHTLVIYTPAIPNEHKQWEYFRNNGFAIKKRAEVLGIITRSRKGVCIAGTHGKTTTSTMAAHLLHNSHVECAAFLGGISKNYNTNLLLSDKSDYVVIEADEYDRSFLQLTPYMAVVTATDPDHLDIYGTKENYIEGFAQFTEKIRDDGFLVIHEKSELKPRLKQGAKCYIYGREKGDFHASNIRIGSGRIIFDFVSPIENISDIELGVPVSINIDNGVAAMAMAQLCGACSQEIKDGMLNFKGVERRFDFRLKKENMVLLSDYAHHPDEIKQCALSMKELYNDRKVTAIFQPHLYSRTRDFYREFAQSLSIFDEVILVDIYPARELPIPGVSNDLIYDLINAGVKKRMCKKEEVIKIVTEERGDFEVLICLGAGDLEDYMPQITEIMNR